MNAKIFPCLLSVCLCSTLATRADSNDDALSPARAVIKKYDLNHDGVLDQSELAAYLSNQNRKYDLNGDGTVTPEEITKYYDPQKRAAKLIKERNLGQPLDAAALQDEMKLDPPEDKSLLTQMSEYVQLQKSFLTSDDKAKDPARLSWTWSRHDSSYGFDGALSLSKKVGEMPFLGSPSLFGVEYNMTPVIQPTVEAHVANVNADSPDSVAFGMPIRLLASSSESNTNRPWLTGFQLALVPVFETDSRFDVKTFTVNPIFSPTIVPPDSSSFSWLATGIDRELFWGVTYRWRPFFGAELGRVIDDGGVAGLQETKTITRLLGRVYGELQITEQFLISGEFVARQQLDSEGHTFLYGEISPQITLDPKKHVAVGATLKSGKRPPKFVDEHAANLWVGLKF